MEWEWSDPPGIPGEGPMVLLGSDHFSGLSRQNPPSVRKCFGGLNSNILKHLPLCRGFKSCLETGSSGPLGSCLRYWQGEFEWNNYSMLEKSWDQLGNELGSYRFGAENMEEKAPNVGLISLRPPPCIDSLTLLILFLSVEVVWLNV